MQGNILQIVHLTGILSILVLCGTVGLIVLKQRNLRIEKLSLRYTLKHQEYFDYVAANLDDDLPLNRPYMTLSPLERKVIRQKLFAWISQIRGEQRTRIIELCQNLGFEAEEKHRLHSRFRWIQVEAAYNLGVMRSKDACPLLLELQADETFGSSLFIITRAIVRCARDINDINRMVQMIIEHRKSCSELVADILQEVEFDYSPLLIDWLQSEEDELVQIALLCLNSQTTLKLDEHLVKLIKSEKKEIRVKAAKVWLGQNASPAPAIIIDFLAHPDWEIRAQAAKAAGSIGSPIFLDSLKETIQDEFWWVRYYSAKSLERLEGNALQPVYEVVI